MKAIIKTMTLLLILLGVSSLEAQSKTVNKFYKKYKSKAEVTNIKLNAFVLDISRSFIDDEEAKDIIKKISKVRLLVIEELSIVKDKDLKGLIENIKSERFEDLINVRDGQSKVQILIRDNPKGITDLLLLVRDIEDNQFVLLSLEGLFKYEDLENLDIDFDGKEHLDKLKVRT